MQLGNTAFGANAQQAQFDLSNGTVAGQAANSSATIQSIGNGWYRCSITATSLGTSGNYISNIRVFPTAANAVAGTAFTGDGTSGVLVWGQQSEAGAFPTSYIPTTAAAATRAVDVASMPVGAWFNAAQGTLVAEAVITGEPPASFSPIAGFVGANANTDLLNIYAQTSNTTLHTQVKTASTGIYAGDIFPVFAYGSTVKAAIAYGPSSARSAFNGAVGALGAYGAPATLPTLTNLLLFGAAGFQTTLSGYHRRVRYWPRALSAVELQAATR